MDSTQKSAGSFIKASGNPQALLQFRKKVLNHVSPEILFSVKLLGLLLIRLWKNHCLHLLLIQAIQQPCFDSVGNVFEQGLDLIQNSAQQHVSALQIKSLTRAFIKTYWIAKLITGCMNFGCKTFTDANDIIFGMITFFMSDVLMGPKNHAVDLDIHAVCLGR